MSKPLTTRQKSVYEFIESLRLLNSHPSKLLTLAYYLMRRASHQLRSDGSVPIGQNALLTPPVLAGRNAAKPFECDRELGRAFISNLCADFGNVGIGLS